MKRILIITDDYNELTFLETLLKKIGFDALGIQSASQALEQAMVINPDMLILADTLKKQGTHALLENLMSFRPQMFVVLLKKSLKEETQHVPEFINKIIKSPVDPLDLIRSICQVASLNEEQFLDKYSKLGLFRGETQQKSIVVSGRVNQEVTENKFVRGMQSEDLEKSHQTRKKHFEKVVQEISEPLVKSFNSKEAVREAQEFRIRGKDNEIVRIDEQRKRFVKALFKK